MKNLIRIPSFLLFAGALFLVAGCVTTKNTGPKYTFYPPAPDAPHLQYLTSFGTEKDLRGTGRDNFIAFVTGQAPSYMPILKPYGGATTTNSIYVCDTVGVILRLELDSHKMSAISPQGPAALKLPVNLALDERGWFYVADAGREEVVILDANKNLVGTLGGKGVMEPRDVALSKDRIYIGDRLNHCVHVVDKVTRTNLFDIPRPEEATATNSRLYQPVNLTLDDRGRLYVSDIGGYRVQVYDADGKYLRSVGRYGDNFGEFARLKGVAVDREHRLYTVDAAGQLAQIFDENGQLLMWFGEPGGSRYPLALPAKVIIDYDNTEHFRKYISPDFEVEYLVIVINQYGPRKVTVFGFGHQK